MDLFWLKPHNLPTPYHEFKTNKCEELPTYYVQSKQHILLLAHIKFSESSYMYSGQLVSAYAKKGFQAQQSFCH